MVKSDSVYVVSIKVALPLSAVDVRAKMSDIVQVFADLSSCGTCVDKTTSPVTCQNCRVLFNVAQTSARRLLVPATIVDLSIEQLNGEFQASTTASLLTESTINTMLTTKSIPNCAVTSIAAVAVLAAPSASTTGGVRTTGNVVPTTTRAAITTKAAVTTAKAATTTGNVAATTAKAATTAAPAPGGTDRRGIDGTPAPASESGPDMGVIGGAIGGVLAVLVVIGVIVYCTTMKQPTLPAAVVAPAQQEGPADGTHGPAGRFNQRHRRSLSVSRLESQTNFQIPSNAILVMGPLYRPVHHPRPQ